DFGATTACWHPRGAGGECSGGVVGHEASEGDRPGYTWWGGCGCGDRDGGGDVVADGTRKVLEHGRFPGEMGRWGERKLSIFVSSSVCTGTNGENVCVCVVIVRSRWWVVW